MIVITKTLKAFVLFSSILLIVTAGAAVLGCLFLSNGQIDYLVHPQSLFEFLWVTRAGLKVTIFFVTLNIFFMFAADGALSRRWLQPSPDNRFDPRMQFRRLRTA